MMFDDFEKPAIDHITKHPRYKGLVAGMNQKSAGALAALPEDQCPHKSGWKREAWLAGYEEGFDLHASVWLDGYECWPRQNLDTGFTAPPTSKSNLFSVPASDLDNVDE